MAIKWMQNFWLAIYHNKKHCGWRILWEQKSTIVIMTYNFIYVERWHIEMGSSARINPNSVS